MCAMDHGKSGESAADRLLRPACSAALFCREADRRTKKYRDAETAVSGWRHGAARWDPAFSA